MARPVRMEFPGALYHVTSRGNARQAIFLNDGDRSRFLKQLERCLEQYELRIFAYVLMDNHYHLFVQTPRANLSKFCQRLNTSYALYARYRQKKPGHIFQGRYKAKLVQDESYLQILTRYIHLNPVRTRAWARRSPKERVEFLCAYRWSSLPGYIRQSAAVDFVCYDALLDFGPDRTAARRAYRRYVLAAVDGADDEAVRLMGASGHAIGGKAFVDRIESELRDKIPGTGHKRDLALPAKKKAPGLSLRQVDRLVSRALGAPISALRKPHARGIKAIAVETAARLSHLPLRKIGEHYGLSPSGVTSLRQYLAEEKSGDRRRLVEIIVAKAGEQRDETRIP